MKKTIIVITVIFLLPQSGLLAVNKHYNINRPKNTKNLHSLNSNEEILADLGWGVLYSLRGGYSAVHGNIPGAIIDASNGMKNFLKVAEKYQENLQFEREVTEKSYNSYEQWKKSTIKAMMDIIMQIDNHKSTKQGVFYV